MPGRFAHCVVPSEKWPSLEATLAAAPLGAVVELLPGYVEEVDILVLDRALQIEGPPDHSATIITHGGIVCAVPAESDAAAPRGPELGLCLRSLTVRSSGPPAIIVAGAGKVTIEFCDVSGPDIGVQVLGRLGAASRSVCLAQTLIHSCRVGLHLASPLPVLDLNKVERNQVGAVVAGVELPEGDSEQLQPLRRAIFCKNRDADVRFDFLSVRDAVDGEVHQVEEASPGGICVRQFGKPEGESVAAKTESGLVALRFDGSGKVKVALSDPFEFAEVGTLPRRGRWFTGALPSTPAGIQERRRDFARLVMTGSQASLLVVPPRESPPVHWTLKATKHAVGDMSRAVLEAAASELDLWLRESLCEVGCGAADGLVDRCIALLGAGEGVSFALTYRLSPVLLQPHFMILVSPQGEVCVACFAFVAAAGSQPSSNGSTPWLLRFVSEDVNSWKMSGGGEAVRVRLRFAVSATDEPDMAQVVARSTAALRSAVDLGEWGLVLTAGS